MTDYMDQGVAPPPDNRAEAQKMLEGMTGEWEACLNGSGQAEIRRQGVTITKHWDKMFQCIIASTKHRFPGQGETPLLAFEDAKKQVDIAFEDLKGIIEHVRN